MAEEQTVAGAGWVSDDSSFYGSENEQEHQQLLCENFNSRPFWPSHNGDPNVLRLAAKKRKIGEAATVAVLTSSHASGVEQTAHVSKPNASKTLSMSGTDRQALERERLARDSKLKPKASPEPRPKLGLFNVRDVEVWLACWQLESA